MHSGYQLVKCLCSDEEGKPCDGIYKANPPKKNYKCSSCGYEIDRQTYLDLADAINDDEETSAQIRDFEEKKALSKDKQGLLTEE